MKKLLVVNNYQEQCGIYQHGKRMAQALQGDTRFSVSYVEADSAETFLRAVSENNPDYILYNWNTATLPWLTPAISYAINAKQLFFYHEFDLPHSFKYDAIVMANMSNAPDSKIYGLPRVTFEFDLTEIQKNEVTNIGSFGFGFENKGFERLCQRVSDEFEKAIINLHITASFFGDPNGILVKQITDRCINMVDQSRISINITNHFISDKEMVEFLRKNDINLFLYDYQENRGLSSSIDYAVSAGRPFGVSNSSMFLHVLERFPELNADENSIMQIMQHGDYPSKYFKEQWSNKKLKQSMWNILEAV